MSLESRDFSHESVQPWVSVPDFKDGDKELPKKKTLIKLDSGKEYEMSYEIKFR